MASEGSKVIRVWVDHRRCAVEADAEDALGNLVRCVFNPGSLHALVRNNLGPPPFTPTAAEMERAIAGSLAGKQWEDPRKTYRAAAIEIVRPYVSRFLRGASVSQEAAEAMLDMKDWSQHE